MRIFLPYSPSANDLWKPNRRGIRRSPAYRKWMAEATWVVALAVRDQGSMAGFYRLDMTACPPQPKRLRDLDNLLKATSDALKHGGAIIDDSLAQEIVLRWGALDGPGILVELEPWPSQTLPEDGRSSLSSEPPKPRPLRPNLRAVTIQDAVIGALSDTESPGSKDEASRRSSTSAESIACPSRKNKPKT